MRITYVDAVPVHSAALYRCEYTDKTGRKHKVSIAPDNGDNSKSKKVDLLSLKLFDSFLKNEDTSPESLLGRLAKLQDELYEQAEFIVPRYFCELLSKHSSTLLSAEFELTPRFLAYYNDLTHGLKYTKHESSLKPKIRGIAFDLGEDVKKLQDSLRSRYLPIMNVIQNMSHAILGRKKNHPIYEFYKEALGDIWAMKPTLRALTNIIEEGRGLEFARTLKDISNGQIDITHDNGLIFVDRNYRPSDSLLPNLQMVSDNRYLFLPSLSNELSEDFVLETEPPELQEIKSAIQLNPEAEENKRSLLSLAQYDLNVPEFLNRPELLKVLMNDEALRQLVIPIIDEILEESRQGTVKTAQALLHWISGKYSSEEELIDFYTQLIDELGTTKSRDGLVRYMRLLLNDSQEDLNRSIQERIVIRGGEISEQDKNALDVQLCFLHLDMDNLRGINKQIKLSSNSDLIIARDILNLIEQNKFNEALSKIHEHFIHYPEFLLSCTNVGINYLEGYCLHQLSQDRSSSGEIFDAVKDEFDKSQDMSVLTYKEFTDLDPREMKMEAWSYILPWFSIT